MEERTVLFGTYEELKNWYDGLEIGKRGSISKFQEFKPFEEQLNKDDFLKIRTICYFEVEINSDKVNMKLKTKLVCLIKEKLETTEERVLESFK